MSGSAGEMEALVRRHIEAFLRGDIAAVMADYSADAVMLGTFGTIEGTDALTAAFAGAGDVTRGLVVDELVCAGDTALMVFHSDVIAFGVDTFVVRDGKIVMQTTASGPS